MQYYHEFILPELVKNRTVLVSAHGNSIRALRGHIENIPSNDIPNVLVRKGVLHIYELELDSDITLKVHYNSNKKNEVII